jgi:hypothetical protein
MNLFDVSVDSTGDLFRVEDLEPGGLTEVWATVGSCQFFCSWEHIILNVLTLDQTFGTLSIGAGGISLQGRGRLSCSAYHTFRQDRLRSLPTPCQELSARGRSNNGW